MTTGLQMLQALLDADASRQQPKGVMTNSRNLDPRLHQYQVQAVQHLWENPRAGLFLEMLSDSARQRLCFRP